MLLYHGARQAQQVGLRYHCADSQTFTCVQQHALHQAASGLMELPVEQRHIAQQLVQAPRGLREGRMVVAQSSDQGFLVFVRLDLEALEKRVVGTRRARRLDGARRIRNGGPRGVQVEQRLKRRLPILELGERWSGLRVITDHTRNERSRGLKPRTQRILGPRIRVQVLVAHAFAVETHYLIGHIAWPNAFLAQSHPFRLRHACKGLQVRAYGIMHTGAQRFAIAINAELRIELRRFVTTQQQASAPSVNGGAQRALQRIQQPLRSLRGCGCQVRGE